MLSTSILWHWSTPLEQWSILWWWLMQVQLEKQMLRLGMQYLIVSLSDQISTKKIATHEAQTREWVGTVLSCERTHQEAYATAPTTPIGSYACSPSLRGIIAMLTVWLNPMGCPVHQLSAWHCDHLAFLAFASTPCGLDPLRYRCLLPCIGCQGGCLPPTKHTPLWDTIA